MSFNSLPMELLHEILAFAVSPAWPIRYKDRITRNNCRLVSRVWNSSLLITIIQPSSIRRLARHGSEEVIVHELTNLFNKYHGYSHLSEPEEALRVVVRRNQKRATALLLQRGVNPNSKREVGSYTPLLYAMAFMHYEIAHLLLEFNADPRIQTGSGRTALHIVASDGALDMAELLLNKGADINIQMQGGDTPLACAIRKCQIRMLKFLLSKGAVFHSWPSPIGMAAHTESVDVLRILLDDVGLGIEDDALNGLTPLQNMARQGYEEPVRFLLDRGANIAAGANRTYGTALYLAVAHHVSTSCPFSLAKLLIERGADTESKDFTGETPLHAAAIRGYASVVQLLLDHGADLEAKDDRGQTALHKAAADNHVEVVKVLLDSGASTGELDEWDEATPLQIAEKRGYERVASLLLQHGKTTT